MIQLHSLNFSNWLRDPQRLHVLSQDWSHAPDAMRRDGRSLQICSGSQAGLHHFFSFRHHTAHDSIFPEVGRLQDIALDLQIWQLTQTFTSRCCVGTATPKPRMQLSWAGLFFNITYQQGYLLPALADCTAELSYSISVYGNDVEDFLRMLS